MPQSIHLRASESAFGNFHAGRWLWALDQIEIMAAPVAARGYQQLWNWERSAE